MSEWVDSIVHVQMGDGTSIFRGGITDLDGSFRAVTKDSCSNKGYRYSSRSRDLGTWCLLGISIRGT